MFRAEDTGERGGTEVAGRRIEIVAIFSSILTKSLYFSALILYYTLMKSIRTKPRSSEKVRMFIEIARLRISEGVIFEGKKIKEVLPWKN
jgi:hypothetical protein